MSLIKREKFFKIGNVGDFIDLKEKPLILEVCRSFNKVKFSGVSIKIKFVLSIVGLESPYEIFELEGSVRKKGFGFIFKLGEGNRTNSNETVGSPLTQEPNWDINPLFGFQCRLKVKSGKDLGIKVQGGSSINFFLPTFRFGEMAKNSGSGKLDKIKLKVETVVNDKHAEASEEIDAGWGSLSQTIDEKLTGGLKKRYPGLSFADKSSFVTVKNKDRSQDTKLIDQRLETIVLHCVSAKAYCTDAALYESREEQVKNIPAMYDWEKCVEIFNKFHVGAHYIIGRGGKICELATARMKVAHGGRPDRYPQMKGRGNARTIGIELVGHADQFRKEIIKFYKREKKKIDKRWAQKFEEFVRSEDRSIPRNSTRLEDYVREDSVFYGFTEAQYEALKILLNSLGKRYGYIRVCTHEWLKTTKSDPGDKFDWKTIRTALAEAGAPQTEDFAFDRDHVHMVQGLNRFARRK